MILPGVFIGEQVIVGAMSVVSKDVPDHQSVAGNPAKKIGESPVS
jgi:maltose O-acetyltransferase